MSGTMKKRTLDAFFAPPAKKFRVPGGFSGNDDHIYVVETPTEGKGGGKGDDQKQEFTAHPKYPFPIPCLPKSISTPLSCMLSDGKDINKHPDLDLVYFQPFMPKNIAHEIFQFLREELPFYRVEYKIKRGGIETQVRTPRYTTVFGVDDTSLFNEYGEVVDAKTGAKANTPKSYPRPIPRCLDNLRLCTEASTGFEFNFCLVNYYSSGTDSISYHSDDEKFLGVNPTIASFSFGAPRDFLMKHKPTPPCDNEDPKLRDAQNNTLKFSLDSGDMILMRGKTQANWMHAIPKRGGKKADECGGRINITFRRAMVKGGTENYYRYNVGDGPVYKWDKNSREMRLWEP